MFKTLHIQNFQSHKDTLLEFDPGVNVIIGQSDSGKTAILRALKWLITNRPGGDAFRSNWGGDTLINLSMEEGRIQRIKSAKNNMYLLNDQEFKAMGMDVPEEIKSVLNINEVNLQAQLDRPFLLDDSSGEVAQYFNQIARLDIIDTGRKNIEKWYRQITSDIQYKESEKERLEENSKEYAYLPKLEIDIEVIEQLEEKQKQTGQRIGKLKQWILSYETLQNNLEDYSETLLLEKPMNNLIELFQEKKKQEHKKADLQGLLDAYEEIQDSIYSNNCIIEAENQVNVILALYDTRNDIQNKQNALSKIVNNLQVKKENIKEKELRILEMEQDFDHYMPDVCPLCGQEIK